MLWLALAKWSVVCALLILFVCLMNNWRFDKSKDSRIRRLTRG